MQICFSTNNELKANNESVWMLNVTVLNLCIILQIYESFAYTQIRKFVKISYS
ncbi:MAG: hypothetical protein JWP12_2730 [Bacteroidetes bacterium]|nr:hypothetical protein [Bacteroidota bacterium]